ncbi:hypothetical protein COCON_G00119030 [Conger conger]|uniref:Tetraspanin n=1 Tax=Conger conger TaxID=82655 RepID=A0A9Q1DGJ9_CONCO|nr:tetraspanin-8-like [Conger conger]KAJ8269296.1 hypothetical protein COCON_G00119030 [Conger conger]
MAKVNSCFKGLFVFFNILFGIAGGVLLTLGILAHSFYHDHEEFSSMFVGVVVLYLMGGITMAISFLGAYGAFKEKKWPLIVFAASMALGFCGLLRAGTLVIILRPEVKSETEEHFRAILPLDEAAPEFKQVADMLQTQLKCCGLFNGYQDWRSSIPDSCRCSRWDLESDKCERVEAAMRFDEELDSDSQQLVYKQPCFPIIEKYMDRYFNMATGIIFGFAFLALMGLIMSVVLIWYIKRRDPPAPMIFSFNQDPPKYTQLYNPS